MIQIKVNPAQFAARLKEVGVKLGQALPPNKGTIAHSGVTLEYSYDGSTEVAIEVLGKPFYVTQSEIENKINAWFAGS